MDRKVWLPSGGSLVIDRTEAMTVVDVNTGKFVGSGGNLEETVTKNNIEAAEEIVRQLRLRDIGGIIVIDFIDMVLESNRELVVRRLLECLGRDRTKHQVAEVTSLGLVQMTRKRVGSGLIEVFSETCDHCNGRGFIIHTDPVDKGAHQHEQSQGDNGGSSRRRGRGQGSGQGGGAQGGNGTGSGQQSGQQSSQQALARGVEEQRSDRGADRRRRPRGRAQERVRPARGRGGGRGHRRGPQPRSSEPAARSAPRHGFPEDNGPWSGDDAHDADRADGQATAGGVHVELESDVPNATAPPTAPTAPAAPTARHPQPLRRSPR